jgi:cell wall assembly regulator SMI1
VLIRRSSYRTPAAVSLSWARLEGWLSQNIPRTFHKLPAGAPEFQIRNLENVIGQKLPDDVRESLRIHNGQGWPDSGVIYGCPLCNVGEILSNWRCWVEEILPQQESNPELWGLDGYTAEPAETIALLYATRGWIPLHDWDGDHFGVDLNPGPRGMVGQVINFGRHAEAKCVLALSWAHFLEDVADELEAGNFLLEFDDAEQITKFCPKDPVCADDQFPNGFSSWSIAKLPDDFCSLTDHGR